MVSDTKQYLQGTIYTINTSVRTLSGKAQRHVLSSTIGQRASWGPLYRRSQPARYVLRNRSGTKMLRWDTAGLFRRVEASVGPINILSIQDKRRDRSTERSRERASDGAISPVCLPNPTHSESRGRNVPGRRIHEDATRIQVRKQQPRHRRELAFCALASFCFCFPLAVFFFVMSY